MADVKRIQALERLGKDSVQATAWALPEADGLVLERLMRSAEAESALEQGWLLQELIERFALSGPELARRFDKSLSWVSRRLALVRQRPESIQERVRRGELQPHTAMKHLVSLARANRQGAETLAAVFGAARLSTRDVAALCIAWKTGNEAVRVERPVVHLRQKEGRDGAPHLRAQALGVRLVPGELEPLSQAPLDEDDATALRDVPEVAVAL